jgi:uncharacterized protein (DUF2147 family)
MTVMSSMKSRNNTFFQKVSQANSMPVTRTFNMMSCLLVGATALFVASAAWAQSLPPSAGSEAAGLWIDHTGRGAVEIVPCGGGKLCGSIAWLQDPLDKRGKPLVDGNNPAKEKRSRTICGLQILGNIVKSGTNVWDNGWIYDPDEGKTYDLELKLKTPDKLEVTGYLGSKFFSESYTWTRATANHPRCPSTG